MIKVLRNIALILLFATQVFLLVEREQNSSTAESPVASQVVCLETLSTDPDVDAGDVMLDVNNIPEPEEQSPLLFNKIETRLVEFNHYREISSNFSLVEKINGTVASLVIRCYATKYPFSESGIEDGHFCHFKQFRI